METQSIREYSRLLIENIVKRVILKNDVNGICNELLDSALELHCKSEIIHDTSDSDIFLSDPYEEPHPLPNSSDYWLLDKIKENQPDYISPDLFEEHNESNVTPPMTQNQLWNEEYFRDLIENVETQTLDKSPRTQDLGTCSGNGIRRSLSNLTDGNNSTPIKNNEQRTITAFTFNDVNKGWLGTVAGSISVEKPKKKNSVSSSNCEKIASIQSNSTPSSIINDFDSNNVSQDIERDHSDSFVSILYKERDDQLIDEQTHTNSQPNSFPSSAKKAKLDLSFIDDIKSENMECGYSDSLIDILEDNIGNEQFQSLSSANGDLAHEDENKEKSNFLSDDYSIPMTFDSSADLIWKLKKAQVLISNEPIDSQRPGKTGRNTDNPIIETIERSNDVIRKVNADYNSDYAEKVDIVPQGFDIIGNENIESSMYSSTDEKEILSQSSDAHSSKKDVSTSSEKILGTPPPQQSLSLLHKAPRIGLSKLQNVLTLHPNMKR